MDEILIVQKWLGECCGIFKTRSDLFESKELYIYNQTSIGYIPKEINCLENLEMLEISNCGFINIPEELYDMKNLTTFAVHHCEITNISDKISNLKGLRRLILTCNNLSRLPQSILDMTQIEYCSVGGNKNLKLPGAFRKFLKDRHDGLYDMYFYVKDNEVNNLLMGF